MKDRQTTSEDRVMQLMNCLKVESGDVNFAFNIYKYHELSNDEDGSDNPSCMPICFS